MNNTDFGPVITCQSAPFCAHVQESEGKKTISRSAVFHEPALAASTVGAAEMALCAVTLKFLNRLVGQTS